MHEQHTSAFWRQFDEARLLQARKFARLCILALKDDESDEAREKRDYFKAKRQAINRALREKRHGPEGPPAQSVALKPISVAGQGAQPGNTLTWEQLAAEVEKVINNLEVNDGRR